MQPGSAVRISYPANGLARSSASQDSSATKEKAEGDDDVGEEPEDQDDDVRLPPIS